MTLSKIYDLNGHSENWLKKYACGSEKFHLGSPAAQTMGSIEKFDIPFCSL